MDSAAWSAPASIQATSSPVAGTSRLPVRSAGPRARTARTPAMLRFPIALLMPPLKSPQPVSLPATRHAGSLPGTWDCRQSRPAKIPVSRPAGIEPDRLLRRQCCVPVTRLTGRAARQAVLPGKSLCALRKRFESETARRQTHAVSPVATRHAHGLPARDRRRTTRTAHARRVRHAAQAPTVQTTRPQRPEVARRSGEGGDQLATRQRQRHDHRQSTRQTHWHALCET